MKWALVFVLAVMLVILGVVYMGRVNRPAPAPPAPVASPPPKTPKPTQAQHRAPLPIDITGPLKGRKLVHWVLPQYPEWAEQQGIAGMSQFRIRVSPAGLVMANLEPQLMNNDLRLDEEASAAIRQWRFEEKSNAFGEQWGIVTLRFNLAAASEGSGASLKGLAAGSATTSGAWECVKQWLDGAKREFVYVCKLRPKPKPE